MKRLLMLMLLAGLSLSLAQYEDVDPSGQTVSFWHQHTRDRETALKEIVDEFNATNPYGITVVAEFQGGYGDIFNKMISILGTDEVPDLVVAYQNQAATYQVADGLIDMAPLVHSAKWGLSEKDLSDFFAGYLKQDQFSTFDNAQLAFPPNRSLEVMYYNQEWLAELGYDAPPATPEAFAEVACKAAGQPFSKATSEGSIGYEISIDASRFASWTFAFGGDVFDYDSNQYAYNSDAAVAAMSFLQDLVDQGCVANITEQYGDQTNFGAGRTLFTVGSSSGLPFYRSAVESGAQFNWSVAPLPHVGEDPVMNIYGASVSMPDTGDLAKQVAAWLFVKYYTSAEVQAKWVRASNYFPVRKSVADDLGDYFEADPAYAAAFALLDYSKAEPPMPGYDFVRDLVSEAMAAIIDGDDVKSTLDNLTQESNDILADQF
ncbi:MAG: extracellular solute-binding protein [Deinococcales bacterium]